MVHLLQLAAANHVFTVFFFLQSHSIYAVGPGPARKTLYEVRKLINGTVILHAQPYVRSGMIVRQQQADKRIWRGVVGR